MECLSGCRNPCNVRIWGRGKASYWLSGLQPSDGPQLLEFIRAYSSAPDGLVADAAPPGLMRVLGATKEGAGVSLVGEAGGHESQ